MPFDVEGARKAGYTDAEIAGELAKATGFDYAAAKSAKYSDSEIIAELAKKAAPSMADQIPGGGPAVKPAAAPSIGERIVGGGEAALSTATGATTGLAGGVLNFIGVLGEELARRKSGEYLTDEASKRINEAFGVGQRAYTYEPRTAAGQEALGAVADAAKALEPLAGLGGELATIAQAGRVARAGGPSSTVARAAVEGTARDLAGAPGAAAAQKAVDGSSKAISATQEAAKLLPARTRALVFGETQSPAAGAAGSVGSAAADLAAQRAATAESLPVPIKLTEGQRTRDFAQQRFEQETAKDPYLGAPLRENAAAQNLKLSQNVEAMIDDVGATAPDMREAGRAVATELTRAAARSKAEYRFKYQAADKAGELAEPVDLKPLADYLNANRAGRTSAPIINTIADELGVKGVGGGSLADGSLSAGNATLRQAEDLRKAVNRFFKRDDPNDARVAGEIRAVIDQITEGKGGDLYAQARKARQRHGQLFEDNAIISDLLENRRNTADRRVALEDVFRRTILNGDRDSIGMLRRTFDVSDQKAGFKPQTNGPGAQAWRELQGATLRHLLEEATKGVATDIAGNPIFSAAKLNNALNSLERGGRLEFVLGKQRAQMVRDLNEVSKVVLTSPPGAVNTSHSASVLLAAIAEAGLTGSMTGLPVPVLSALRAGNQFVRDVKIRRRVDAALRDAERKSPGRPGPAVRDPAKTVH